MKIEIEKGIPIPEKRHSNRVYPFSEMEKGDSFFVLKKQKNVYQAARIAGKRLKMKFTIRPEDIGTRVWRVE